MSGCEGRVHARPKRSGKCLGERKKKQEVTKIEIYAYLFLLSFASFLIGLATCIYGLNY
jgi:hypothetical protein